METDCKALSDNNSDSQLIDSETDHDAALITDKEREDDGNGPHVHSIKEPVEILSVEVVQAVSDGQHHISSAPVNVSLETQQSIIEVKGNIGETEPVETSTDEISNTNKADGIDVQREINNDLINSSHQNVTNPDTENKSSCGIASENILNSTALDCSTDINTKSIETTLNEVDITNQTAEDISNFDPIDIRALEEATVISNSAATDSYNFDHIESANISEAHEVSVAMDSNKHSPIEDDSKMEEATEDLGNVIGNDATNVINETHSQDLMQSETMETNTTMSSMTGLSLLAEYGSDNDSDASVIEVPTSSQDYRSRVVEIDSESDSKSSSSDSDVEYLNKLRRAIDKRVQEDDEEDEDDDDNDKGNKAGVRKKPTTKIKAKGEFQLEDLPPIQDLQITVPEEECIVLGNIHSVVDQLVLVSTLPDSVLVDLDTVLFLDKGQRVLGEVFDVLGQISDPLYCVRFNSNAQINEKNIQVGDVVYLAPKTPYTQYIILSSIMKQKGSDASWENDIEPPPRFLDYSDDEEQQQARRQMRNKDRPIEHDDPQKRQRRDSEEPQVSSFSQPHNKQPINCFPPAARNHGTPYRSHYGRHRQQYNNNPQYRNPPQIPLNHNPSSWHSNYYPHTYNVVPPHTPNVSYGGGFSRMPPQSYPQAPMYPMGIPYPPPPHVRPPLNQPAEHQHFMNNAFSMRQPTIPGHYDTSAPPPGNQ